MCVSARIRPTGQRANAVDAVRDEPWINLRLKMKSLCLQTRM